MVTGEYIEQCATKLSIYIIFYAFISATYLTTWFNFRHFTKCSGSSVFGHVLSRRRHHHHHYASAKIRRRNEYSK